MKKQNIDIPIKKRIADCLWRALDTEDMTQAELSDLSGVDARTISSALYQKHLIHIDSLVAICRVLDISIDVMVGLYD